MKERKLVRQFTLDTEIYDVELPQKVLSVLQAEPLRTDPCFYYDMSINDSVPVHNDWAAAYYIIVFCELIPRTDTEDIRNPLLSSLHKAQSAGPHC